MTQPESNRTQPRPGESLYCACINIRKHKLHDWKPQTVYFHATDWTHANNQTRLMYSQQIIRGLVSIVSIAPVVGYFAEDKNERKLIVD